MKKKTFLTLFILLTTFIVGVSGDINSFNKIKLVSANLNAISNFMYCMNDSECPLGIACVENICGKAPSTSYEDNWIQYTTRCVCNNVNVLSCLWSYAGEGSQCSTSGCTVCGRNGGYIY